MRLLLIHYTGHLQWAEVDLLQKADAWLKLDGFKFETHRFGLTSGQFRLLRMRRSYRMAKRSLEELREFAREDAKRIKDNAKKRRLGR